MHTDWKKEILKGITCFIGLNNRIFYFSLGISPSEGFRRGRSLRWDRILNVKVKLGILFPNHRLTEFQTLLHASKIKGDLAFQEVQDPAWMVWICLQLPIKKLEHLHLSLTFVIFFFFLWLDQTTSYLASCSMHALFFPCYLLQATFPTGTLLSLAAAWKPYFFLPCFLFNFCNTVSLPFRLKQPKEKNTVFCFSKNSQSAIEITFYFLLHTNPAKVICNSIKADLPKTYQKETYEENTQTFPSHLCIPAFEKNRFQFLFQD